MKKSVVRCRWVHDGPNSSPARANSGISSCRHHSGSAPRGLLIACLLVAGVALGRDQLVAQENAGSADASTEPVIAATVNGEPIYLAEITAHVRLSLGGRETTPSAEALLQAEALQLLIDRQLVLGSLRQRGEAAHDQEVDLELNRLKESLARHEKTLDDHCQSLGLHPAALRRQVMWQLSWQRCLAKYQTQENLQRYFDRHRPEFDGRRVRVAQILLRNEPAAKPDTTGGAGADGGGEGTREALLTRAAEIRRDITEGSISFADAARQYSQSPSAATGGQLDWITRDGPMPESFTRSALALDVGEISQPLASPFGVHLIQCLEIQPGTKGWQDAREELARAVAEYLFRWLVDQPRPVPDIHVTGRTPYFEPGTHNLVLPDKAATEPITPAHEPTRK